MRGILRATALTAAIGAAALLPTTAASAAPAPAAAPAASGCLTDSEAGDNGRGEITVCVEDGEVRVSGYIEDLKPGGFGGDWGCVGWWIDWETASGPDSSTSTLACPHITGKAYVEFDYDPTESEYGPKDVTGVVDTHITMVWM